MFAITGSASATIFEIGNTGTLSTTGVAAIGSYSANAWGPVDLAVGDTSDSIDFFTIDWFAGIGAGTITANINFIDPTSPASDTGNVSGWSFAILSDIDIIWGAPVSIYYGNGGEFILDLDDIGGGLQCGSSYTISGTIKNVSESAPVPEPATMVLFGIGLMGLAGISRRKK